MSDFDLILEIAEQGYSCLYNESNRFELFTSEGSTGQCFDSLQAAHKWVFSAKHIGNN